MVFAGTGQVEAEHLRLGVAPAQGNPSPPAGDSEVRTLREIEREAILKALEVHNGNRGLAAQALGIDRTTLWRKLAAMSKEDGEGAGD